MLIAVSVTPSLAGLIIQYVLIPWPLDDVYKIEFVFLETTFI